MVQRIDTNLGDLIVAIYAEYITIYGDEDLASVAAAATINDMLDDRTAGRVLDTDAEAA